MSTCSRCGQPVDFRYVNGRCIPIHSQGSCVYGGAASNLRDFSGYTRCDDSSCFQTACPQCGENVYFIRHNGGSVWIDAPLGPPWYKHPCLNQQGDTSPTKKTALISDYNLSRYKEDDELIIGVVKEAEISRDEEFSLINIETGEAENFYLLMKNKAGFLVGRVVILEQKTNLVRCIENDTYVFKVLEPVRVPKWLNYDLSYKTKCPECDVSIKLENLSRHLKGVHNYTVA